MKIEHLTFDLHGAVGPRDPSVAAAPRASRRAATRPRRGPRRAAPRWEDDTHADSRRPGQRSRFLSRGSTKPCAPRGADEHPRRSARARGDRRDPATPRVLPDSPRARGPTAATRSLPQHRERQPRGIGAVVRDGRGTGRDDRPAGAVPGRDRRGRGAQTPAPRWVPARLRSALRASDGGRRTEGRSRAAERRCGCSSIRACRLGRDLVLVTIG